MSVLFSDSILAHVATSFDTLYVYPGLLLHTVITEFKIYEDDFKTAEGSTLLISLGTNDAINSVEFAECVQKLITMIESFRISQIYWLTPRQYAYSENLMCLDVANTTFLEFFDGDSDDDELLEADHVHLNELGCAQMSEFLEKMKIY